MFVRDLRSVPAGVDVYGDIVVVGSGPAGSTLVRELAGSGIRVILLESESIERQAQADALNEIENVGAPRVMAQSVTRNRCSAGSLTAGPAAALSLMRLTGRCGTSRPPLHGSAVMPYVCDRGARRVLFVGCRDYTSGYPRLFATRGIEI